MFIYKAMITVNNYNCNSIQVSPCTNSYHILMGVYSKLLLYTVSLSLILVLVYTVYFIKYNDVLQQLTGPAAAVKVRLQTQDQLTINQQQPLPPTRGYISYQPPGMYMQSLFFFPSISYLIVELFKNILLFYTV